MADASTPVTASDAEHPPVHIRLTPEASRRIAEAESKVQMPRGGVGVAPQGLSAENCTSAAGEKAETAAAHADTC